MTTEQIYYLCGRYLNDIATSDELELLEAVLADPSWNKVVEDIFYTSYHQSQNEDEISPATKERIFNYIITQPRENKIKKTLVPRFIAAASVLFCLFVGYCYFKYKATKQPTNYAIRNNDLSPGGNRAILTLSDGTKITLTKIKNRILALQGGSVITKNREGLIVYSSKAMITKGLDSGYNILTTPRGGQYEVVLSDGSHVWLNSESSIRFPLRFSDKERNVMLSGEGYFEVAQNKNKPFRVVAGNQIVEVLGTHFDISNYQNDPDSRTTLLQGRIRVSRGAQKAVLLPGQQVVLAKDKVDNRLVINTNVNTASAVAWVDGYFYFKKERLPQIMRQLARWYDVDVKYSGKITEEEFTGKVRRDVDLSDALEILTILNVNYRINGRIITISP